jgi:hypothetical protein
VLYHHNTSAQGTALKYLVKVKIMTDFFSNVPVWFIVVFVLIAVLAIAKGIYYRSTVLRLGDGTMVLVTERRFGDNNYDSDTYTGNEPLTTQASNSNIPIAVAVVC